ncbi:unnamed protein product, partial [Discosporangium mesarthrocarpum]
RNVPLQRFSVPRLYLAKLATPGSVDPFFLVWLQNFRTRRYRLMRLCFSSPPSPPSSCPCTQEEAYEEKQKYKEGKFILERCNIMMEDKHTCHPFFPGRNACEPGGAWEGVGGGW